jgi:hypothetical protein
MLVAGTPTQMYQQAHEAAIKMLYDALTMEITDDLLNNICGRIEYNLRSNSEEPMAILFGQSTDYWRRGAFISMEEKMKGLRTVDVANYNTARKMILENLSGVYATIGNLGEYNPSFPDGTWSGEFISE